MKRVKIFAETAEECYVKLASRVNKFLESIPPEKVLDIQYQDCDRYCSAMVVYDDEPAIASNPNPSTRSFDDIYRKE